MEHLWAIDSLVIIALTFLLAGFVKGVVGLGLPTVSLALLTAAFGLKAAIVLMIVPSLITNIWQGAVGGNFKALMKRLWPMFAAAGVCTWFATAMIQTTDPRTLSMLLGVLVALYAVLALVTPQMPPPGRHEPWLSPLMGGLTGIASGMTGSFVVPAVLYMQALGMPRDQLIQAMGLAFTFATLVLGLSFAGRDLMPADGALISAAGLAPAAIGMVIGQRIRRQFSEALFRRVFFLSLLATGLYIIVRTGS